MHDRLGRLWVLPAAGALALAAWCWRPAAVAREQEPPRPALTRVFFGVDGCNQSGCHAEKKPLVEKQPLLCRGTEATIWAESDKHADAYKVLLGERGQQMLKQLGLKGAAGARECLSCHAAVTTKAEENETFRLDEGVSCVVCHGAYQPWVTEHSFRVTRGKFRVLSRQEKEHRYGMTDLWGPVRRAKLCASCHVGNAAEGKVVTHAMYAAGHPPLPGFELASFSNMMPRHWEYLAEKKSDRVRQILGYDGKTQEQAKLVLVGAAVSLAEYARLLAAQASACLKEKDEDSKVLDWASFDCWSCHHDLKSPSWRQARGYSGGRPGRVPLKTWPAELVRLALGHLGEGPDSFERLWGELQAAAVSRPFGDPARVAKGADALAAWADGLAKKLNESAVDAAAARSLLERLPALVKSAPDYDSARQLGWAYRAIWEEQSPGKDPAPLKELTAELGLQLTPGRMQATDRDGVIVRELGHGLRRLNDYDPARFLRLWKGLAAPGK